MADESGSADRGPGLDSSLTAADIETNWDTVCENFDDMGLREELLRGIFAYGFEKPSAIQQRGTLPLIKGRDTIAQVGLLVAFHLVRT
mmetsp:Transcript_67479/g.180293  ORF Transcript_67479/g.180293 Transcript_67479/m.180293 type:complete len:88 (-) Transcript_67479:77-340(-)